MVVLGVVFILELMLLLFCFFVVEVVLVIGFVFEFEVMLGEINKILKIFVSIEDKIFKCV